MTASYARHTVYLRCAVKRQGIDQLVSVSTEMHHCQTGSNGATSTSRALSSLVKSEE